MASFKSSGIWLKSTSSLSMLSCESLSLSMDSLPPELRGNPLDLHPPLSSNPCTMGERREYTFYGLEQDGALRPGGQVPLLTRQRIGLLLNYVAIGALYGGINIALVPFLNKYLEVPQYQTRATSTVINMAWSFKVFAGFLIDSVKICRYRRKPYLIIGWTLCITSLLYLETFDVPGAGSAHEIWRYVVLLTLGTLGYLLANVAADAIVVDIAQREPLPTRGHTQVIVYAAEAFGMTIMSLFVTGTLNGPESGGSFSWSLNSNQVILVLAACAVMPLVGSIWFLHEDLTAQTVPIFSFFDMASCSVAPQQPQPETAPLDSSLNFGARCQLIWRLVQRRTMWQLLMFEFVASFCLTIDSSAKSLIEMNWVNVQLWPKAIEVAVWSLVFIGGLLIARFFLLHSAWRRIYCAATVWAVGVDFIRVACTVFNVVRNRNFWLYMQVLAAPAMALRFLVLLLPIVELIPRGIEGTTYGLVTSFRNMAIPFGRTAYKAIDSYFSISSEDVHLDSDSTRLRVIYTYLIGWAFQLTSLAFIGLLPRQKLEVQQLRYYYGGYSTSAGWIVIIVLSSVLMYLTTVNVLSLFKSTSCFRIVGGSGCGSQGS
ncbi:unnamed protein product [Peronospora destructor]|uniref:Transmembrane protein n=1 Tax=Peronospora destructor TaxID=86335 RepID=A0AAV0UDE1_9STRA|nr:unnamed protein product [Peronospora destructor]